MAHIESYVSGPLTFQVRDGGPADGPAVILLHGFPQRATSWALVEPHLHAAGLRTLAVDQRGYSPGARPTRRRDYRIDLLVDDVVALIDQVGPPVHVVGHDWGAAVAWRLAALRPDLVRSLTSVSVPHPAAMLASLRHRSQLRRSRYMLGFQLPVLPERALSGSAAETQLVKAGMPADAIARYRTEMVDSQALRTALHWYRAIPLTDPRVLRTRVRVPVTHVWSSADVALGREGAELAGDYVDTDYRLEVLEGVSHWIPDEAPLRLAEIVLERVAAS